MATSPSNPSPLPPRFEIRLLGPEHFDWATAIISHSNVFCSPVWATIYPKNRTARCYNHFKTCDYIMGHQLESGLSYGVFDTKYKFKRPESEKTGGALYWDFNNMDATREQLVEQMDFPLVSIAMSYDGVNHLDHSKLKELSEVLPLFPKTYGTISSRDKRDPESWQPKNAGEHLARNGTATREDYMDFKLMKKTAHWLVKEAAIKGFRSIQIECFHDAVHHVWMNPPEPYKAELVSGVRVDEFEDEEVNDQIAQHSACKQFISKVFVALK